MLITSQFLIGRFGGRGFSWLWGPVTPEAPVE
jgi:hypothetical protein